MLGIYQCECQCHTEDDLCVYATYIEGLLLDGDIDQTVTMYGRPLNDEDPFILPQERGMGYRLYWCYPCRRGDHHWTE